MSEQRHRFENQQGFALAGAPDATHDRMQAELGSFLNPLYVHQAVVRWSEPTP